jgi:hypothetical protein
VEKAIFGLGGQAVKASTITEGDNAKITPILFKLSIDPFLGPGIVKPGQVTFGHFKQALQSKVNVQWHTKWD